MRAIEFLTEVRNRMYQYIKSIVPTWPDYIVKDWLYPGFSRYNDKTKRELLIMLNREGLNRNTQWQLVPNMKFTMDIWTSHTLKKLQGRAGGLSDMGMDIPRDAERHATQARLAQQQGGIRSEPVILIKRPDGYELLEGWHRTIQHFHKFPDGYTGPAYIAVSRGQQGVAEGSDSNLSYQGNCTEDDVIEHIFGDVNNFANMVEEHGDEFTVGDLVVKYDPETDVHSFYYKKQGVAEGSLNEFAPVGGDNREPDEEELLRQLASMWWLGTEQQMVKAQKTLAAMGWEIGQDESGDDDAGVFVIRVGDVNGDSYMAFPHSELNLNEGLSKGN